MVDYNSEFMVNTQMAISTSHHGVGKVQAAAWADPAQTYIYIYIYIYIHRYTYIYIYAYIHIMYNNVKCQSATNLT